MNYILESSRNTTPEYDNDKVYHLIVLISSGLDGRTLRCPSCWDIVCGDTPHLKTCSCGVLMVDGGGAIWTRDRGWEWVRILFKYPTPRP